MRAGSVWKRIGVCAAVACASLASGAQTASRWTTETVVKQLDRAAGEFHSLTADLEHVKYTAVIKDSSTESGQIAVRRDEKMRIDIKNPDPRTILRAGDTLFIYNAKINRVEEYDLGKNRAMVDQYLRLGFGTKGEDLKKGYLLTVLGEENLDNRKTIILELTPRSDQVRSQISKIQLWIDESSWIPVQQKFFEAGSGDYFLAHYTNIVKNAQLPASHFKQDWPKGVNRVKPRL